MPREKGLRRLSPGSQSTEVADRTYIKPCVRRLSVMGWLERHNLQPLRGKELLEVRGVIGLGLEVSIKISQHEGELVAREANHEFILE